MPPKNKDRHRQRSVSYYKKRRLARRLAREAEAVARDAAGNEETEDITATPSGQADTSCGVITRSASAGNNPPSAHNSDPQRETQGAGDRGFNFSRPLESLRRRTMNLEQGLATQSKTGETIETLKEMVEKQFQMIEMQAKMIDKQGQEIDKLKRREAQLDMWREQTHDALDFLLWEREGPNKGAYRNKTWGLWSELDNLHQF